MISLTGQEAIQARNNYHFGIEPIPDRGELEYPQESFEALIEVLVPNSGQVRTREEYMSQIGALSAYVWTKSLEQLAELDMIVCRRKSGGSFAIQVEQNQDRFREDHLMICLPES